MEKILIFILRILLPFGIVYVFKAGLWLAGFPSAHQMKRKHRNLAELMETPAPPEDRQQQIEWLAKPVGQLRADYRKSIAVFFPLLINGPISSAFHPSGYC